MSASWANHRSKKKNHRSEVSSSVILHNNNEPFLNWFVTCNEKWILYDNQQWRAQWLDQEEAPKHLPKPNTKKMVMVTVLWSAAHPIDYSFLNPSKTIISEKYAQQINEMHWNLSGEWAQFFSVTTPTACRTTNASKPNDQVLTHPPYSSDHLPTDYHSFNHLDNFLQGKIFPPSAGGRKCFPRVPWILKHRFLCYMNKLFFVGKNMLIVMVLVLINEDVFEPSYNDLKFMVWNHNYLCTNLIHKDYR